MKFIVSTALVILCSGIVIMLLLYLLQNKLIYPAPYVKLPGPAGDNIERIEIGQTYGYLISPPTQTDVQFPLIIFTHGNGELAEMWVKEFTYMVDSGYAVLLVEYPGYGSAGGKPNYNSIKQTMLMAYDIVIQLDHIDKDKVIAYGRSLGGAAASLLAQHKPIAALVLESTFSSLPNLVREKGFPSFLVKDRYDNKAIVGNLDIPVFIYHGTRDEIIPYSHAETLFDAANKNIGPKNTDQNVQLMSANCGHNNCPRFWRALKSFFNEHLT
ncbi:MAG: alpha/beta hydrolase [Pseudomonadota bacterium]